MPTIKFNELNIDGEEISVANNGVYKIPRGSRKISLGVSVLEKDLFRQRMYSFALSDNIVYKTSVPMLSLRQLPKPGTYHVKVSCTKRNGDWTEPFQIITLKVPYPWYMTWWVIGCGILILLSAYLTAIYSINKRKAHKLKIAIQEQEQKVYEE